MWLLLLVLLLFLSTGVVFAQEGSVAVASSATSEQLNQKLKMISHILNASTLTRKLQSSENQNAKDMVSRARENYAKIEGYINHQQYLEASAVIAFVLRDLSSGSRLLNEVDRQKKGYQKAVEKFDAFVLPKWKTLASEDEAFLQETVTRIEQLKNYAIENSQDKGYLEATKLMETAFYLKTILVSKLPHERNIIYDLEFSSDEDRYQYMINRTYHYMELVDLAISKSQPDLQTRKMADNYLYISIENLEMAEILEQQGKISDAITELAKSIEYLSAALKGLGIKI